MKRGLFFAVFAVLFFIVGCEKKEPVSWGYSQSVYVASDGNVIYIMNLGKSKIIRCYYYEDDVFDYVRDECYYDSKKTASLAYYDMQNRLIEAGEEHLIRGMSTDNSLLVIEYKKEYFENDEYHIIEQTAEELRNHIQKGINGETPDPFWGYSQSVYMASGSVVYTMNLGKSQTIRYYYFENDVLDYVKDECRYGNVGAANQAQMDMYERLLLAEKEHLIKGMRTEGSLLVIEYKREYFEEDNILDKTAQELRTYIQQEIDKLNSGN